MKLKTFHWFLKSLKLGWNLISTLLDFIILLIPISFVSLWWAGYIVIAQISTKVYLVHLNW